MMRNNLPCLPLIRERFWNEIKSDVMKDKNKFYPDFEMTMFVQIWGSTALGFGGIGGQAITGAYTTVIEEKNSGWCGVFFGERFAYKVLNPARQFVEDLHNHNMKPVYQMQCYIREDV